MLKLVFTRVKVPPGKVRRFASGFTLIELVIVISVIGILAAIALPSYNKIKSKAKEAEVKAGLHNIQINIERFAVDNDGNYPQYLIGGECSAYVLEYTEDGQINQYLIETERSLNCDPMIRMGYVNAYPRNPFVSMRKPVQLLQGEVGDPLRSAFPDGQETGTRFGANCDVMGQVLCDARWMEWLYFDQKQEKMYPRPTWANIQYPFYDTWYNGRPRPFLSGSFMYKSMGEVMANGCDTIDHDRAMVGGEKAKTMDNHGQTVFPISNSMYILGAWGSLSSKGMDILGEEPLVLFRYEGSNRVAVDDRMFVFDPEVGNFAPPKPVNDTFDLMGVPSWTRGVNRAHIGPLWGSPYGPGSNSGKQLSIGNPNGIKDSIIFVLTGDNNADLLSLN